MRRIKESIDFIPNNENIFFHCKIASLKKIDTYDIGNNVEEPSGLAFDGEFLYTVCDNTTLIYKYSINGIFQEAFETGLKNLEGITNFGNNTFLNNFLNNVNAHLKDDGYFVCTTFDAHIVHSKFVDNKFNIMYTDSYANDNILLSVVKNYQQTDIYGVTTITGSSSGSTTVATTGVYIPQYVVDSAHTHNLETENNTIVSHDDETLISKTKLLLFRESEENYQQISIIAQIEDSVTIIEEEIYDTDKVPFVLFNEASVNYQMIGTESSEVDNIQSSIVEEKKIEKKQEKIHKPQKKKQK